MVQLQLEKKVMVGNSTTEGGTDLLAHFFYWLLCMHLYLSSIWYGGDCGGGGGGGGGDFSTDLGFGYFFSIFL